MPIGSAHGPASDWRDKATDVSTITMQFDDPTVTIRDGRSYIEIDGLQSICTPLHPNLSFSSLSLEFDVSLRIDHIEAELGTISTTPLSAPPALNPAPVPIGLDRPPVMPTAGFRPYSGQEYPQVWFDHRTGMGLNAQDHPTVFLVLFAYPVHVEDDVVRSIDGIRFTIHTHNEPKADKGPIAESYDLVVIGNTTIQPAADILVGHKGSIGVKAKYVTLTDIYSGTYFTVQGANNRERIKYFIKDAHENWDTDNFLLFGDVEAIPAYYVPYTDPYTTSVPTDVYYADIYTASGGFANWTGATGTSSTFTAPDDLYVDVKVGRLPVKTLAEADVVVDKIRHYENETDKAWFNNAVLIGTDAFGQDEGEHGMDKVAEILGDSFNITKLYHSQGKAIPEQISPAIEAGAGIVSYAGHGMRGYLEINETISYAKWHVNALTNGYMLPISTQAACFTGEYDMAATDSYAENWVKKAGGGGIASMGAARAAYGWYGTGWTTRNAGKLNNRFYQALMDGRLTAGALYSTARLYYLNERGLQDGMDFKTLIQFNWFADPSMRLNGTVTAEFEEPPLLVPGVANDINLTFSNTGLAANVTVEADLSAVPLDWTVEVPGTFKVPSGAGAMTIEVTPPVDTVAGTMLGIPVEVRLTDLDHTIFDGSVHLEVAHVFGLDLTSDMPVGGPMTAPGGRVEVNITVDNTGNGAQQVTLEVVDLHENWTSDIDTVTHDLPIEGSSQAVLIVDIPSHNLPVRHNVKVRGSVTGQDVHQDLEVPIEVRMQTNWSAELDVDRTDASPGDNVTFNLTIANEGNVQEDVEVQAEVPVGWNITHEGGTSVGPYSSGATMLELHVPERAVTGLYEVNVTAKTSEKVEILPFLIYVEPWPAIELVAVAGAIEVEYLENGTAELIVENMGNAPLNLSFEAEVEGDNGDWALVVSTSSLDLEPWDSSTVGLTVAHPAGTLSGNYTVTVEVKGGHDGIEASDLEDLTLFVRPFHEMEVLLSKEKASVVQGGDIKVDLVLNNSGNVPEEVTDISFHLPDGWSGESDKDGLVVDQFTEGRIGLVMTLPKDTLMGPYSVSIGVKAGGDVHSLPLKVHVLQEWVFELGTDTTAIALRKGETFLWRVNITNLGNGNDVFTMWVPKDQAWASVDRKEAEVAVGGVTTIVLTISPTRDVKTGDHKVIVQVSSGSGELKTVELTVTVKARKVEQGTGLDMTMMSVLALVIVLVCVIMVVTILQLRRRGGGKPQEGLPPASPPVAPPQPEQPFEQQYGPPRYDAWTDQGNGQMR